MQCDGAVEAIVRSASTCFAEQAIAGANSPSRTLLRSAEAKKRHGGGAERPRRGHDKESSTGRCVISERE